MEQTHFVDCCGLTDSDDHYVSAKDVAIMARELTVNYPEIFTYAGIWMENITHVTKQGTKEFGLTNTNKLLKQYSYATGLKTGSTSKAKYCLAGTASKDGVDLIAVVMAAPDNKARFSEAITMFQYGFANCNVYQDLGEAVYEIPVEGGMTEAVEARLYQPFSYLSTEGADLTDVTSTIEYDTVQAPVFAGDVVGTITYKAGDTVLGQEKLVATADVAAKGYGDFLKESIGRYFLGTW
jgi:D-alanyl-D-alanine carboxypeptidase (penicillin-binding protein 5/6)